MAGVTMIELYERYHVWALIDVAAAFVCLVLALVAICMAFDNTNVDSYFVTFAVFFILAVSLFVVGVPHVHERGFKAKVDNITAWAEISTHYVMTDLDPDGVFTFCER